jgi:hypothetical protein
MGVRLMDTIKAISNCGRYEVIIQKDCSGKTYGFDIFKKGETEEVVFSSDGFETAEDALNDIKELHKITNF